MRVLLIMEKGAWLDLSRRSGVNLPDTRLGQPARATLILQAAHTLLPEADVTELPQVARDELQAGLTGPLRAVIAGTDPSARGTLEGLRDQLVEALVATAGRVGALMLADRVHLSRLVLDKVPPIIAAACVCWYGSYRSAEDPHEPQVETLHDLYNNWLDEPRERPHAEMLMREAARQVVGDHPENLIVRPV